MHKEFDDNLRTKYGQLIIGCDEVGRGCWASSIVAGAVCLPNDFILPGLTDSKLLKEKTRNEFAAIIKENALAWAVAEITAKEIDERGITWANIEVMKRASLDVAKQLGSVDLYIFDQSPCTSLNPHIMLPKADSTSMTVAAASVLAKTHRDNMLIELGKIYPEYGFENHKGYINKKHIDAVNEYGILENIHRTSFKVKGYICRN
jgi:ribonuclease HII